MVCRDVALVHQDNESGTQAARSHSNILELNSAPHGGLVDVTPATGPSLGSVDPSLHRAPPIKVEASIFSSLQLKMKKPLMTAASLSEGVG